MVNHSFSDFSYAVNPTSAKKGYKEVLVCFIYNGVEVLRKVYIPEKEGTSYVFEAKKIIDQEMKSGVLASYSYKFVKRKESGKPNWKWISITAGIAALVVAGMSVGMYFVGKAAGETPIKPTPLPDEYTVTFAGSRYNKVGKVETVKRGSNYECTDLKPVSDTNYLNLGSISMGGVMLSNQTDYTFDNLSYKLSISKPADGDIIITISSDPEQVVVADPEYKIAEDGHAIVTKLSCTEEEKARVTDVTIPEVYIDKDGEHEVTEITAGILNNCSQLKNLTVPFIGLNKNAIVNGSTFSHTMASLFSTTTFTNSYFVEQVYYNDQNVVEWKDFYVPWSLQKIVVTNATSIPAGAFCEFRYVKEIEIRSSIQSNANLIIENCAFYGCSNLTSLIYPDSVWVIRKKAFQNCSSLKKFNLTNIVEIDTMAFLNCSGFLSVVVPDTVVSIQEEAFSGSISGMVATPALKKLDGWKDNWCTAPIVYGAELDEHGNITTYQDASKSWSCIIVADSIDGELKESAYVVQFQGDLTTTEGVVTVPDSINIKDKDYKVRHIGDFVFNYNNNVKKVIFNSSELLTIGNNCFEGCVKLESLEGSGLASIQTLGNHAFSNCAKLVINDSLEDNATSDQITFDNIRQIGDFAFSECWGLKNLALPQIRKFGNYSFYNCCWHNGDVYDPSQGALEAIKAFPDLSSLGVATFYQDRGFGGIMLYPESQYSMNAIPDYHVEIPDLCFCRSGAYSGTALPVTAWISRIGVQAFAYCDFTSIDFKTDTWEQETVQKISKIDQGAFEGCTSLIGSVTIPASVVDLGDAVFKGCSKLSSVHITSAINYIPSDLCAGCSNLTSFTYDNNVNSIGSCAFQDCVSLTTLQKTNLKNGCLPATVGLIGDEAFANCNALDSITISWQEEVSPEELTMGKDVFKGWSTSHGSYQYNALCSAAETDTSHFVNIAKGWLVNFVQHGNFKTKWGWDLTGKSTYSTGIATGSHLGQERYFCAKAGSPQLYLHVVENVA